MGKARQRVFEALADDTDNKYAMIDSTIVCALCQIQNQLVLLARKTGTSSDYGILIRPTAAEPLWEL